MVNWKGSPFWQKRDQILAKEGPKDFFFEISRELNYETYEIFPDRHFYRDFEGRQYCLVCYVLKIKSAYVMWDSYESSNFEIHKIHIPDVQSLQKQNFTSNYLQW